MDITDWIDSLEDLGDYGSYTDKKKIGVGGFSRVYSVRKGKFRYAMKEPKMELLEDEEFESGTIGSDKYKDSFMAEMRVWGRLSKNVPNDVVRLIDCNKIPNPWMVMEYADSDYDKAIKNGETDPKDVLQLLRSLRNIHDQGVVHRDIKPKNILRVNGKWKFSDFGLSKTSDMMSTTGTGKGTVYYMAPEQLIEKYGGIDERTDIWQMGILLYNVISGGRYPYKGRTEDEVRLEIVMHGPDYSDVPVQYHLVLEKALSADKSDRYQDIASFIDDFEDILRIDASDGIIDEADNGWKRDNEKTPYSRPVGKEQSGSDQSLSEWISTGHSLSGLSDENIAELESIGIRTVNGFDAALNDERRFKEIVKTLSGVGPKDVRKWKDLFADSEFKDNQTESHGYSVFEEDEDPADGYSETEPSLAEKIDNDVSLDELIADGHPLSELRGAGFRAYEFRDAGCTAKELFEIGFTFEELKDLGYLVEDMIDAGFTVKYLLDNGYTVSDFREAGFTAKELSEAGASLDALIEAGYSRDEFEQPGYERVQTNHMHDTNRVNGVSNSESHPKEIVEPKGSLNKTIISRHSLSELKEMGYEAKDLREFMYTAMSLKKVGYSAKDLKNAGYSIKELMDAGYIAWDMKVAGYTAAELKSADFPLRDVSLAGYSVTELKNAGYTVSELRPFFVVKELKEGGYSLKELADSCPLLDLVSAGFSKNELRSVGFSESILNKYNFWFE